MSEDTGLEELNGLMSVGDDKIGMGDDILQTVAGLTYRFYMIPVKLDYNKTKDNPTVKQELEKGKAKIIRKGEPGWFGPEESYILFPGIAYKEIFYKQNVGYFSPPKDLGLRKRCEAAFGDIMQRFGCIVIVYGIKLSDRSVNMDSTKDPKFDFVLNKFICSGQKMAVIRKSLMNKSSIDKDIIITCKAQGKGVVFDSISHEDSYFLNDSYITKAKREELYEVACKARKRLPLMMAKEKTPAELEALVGSKTAAEQAKNVPAPVTDQNLGGLIE